MPSARRSLIITTPGAGLHGGGTASTAEPRFAAYVHLGPIVRLAQDWKTVVVFVLAIRAKSLPVWAHRMCPSRDRTTAVHKERTRVLA